MWRDAGRWVTAAASILLIILGAVGLFSGQVVWFAAGVLLSLVHLASGLAGGIIAWRPALHKHLHSFARYAGVGYLLVGLAGLLWSGFAAWLALNAATSALHLVVGAVLAALGFWRRQADRQAATA